MDIIKYLGQVRESPPEYVINSTYTILTPDLCPPISYVSKSIRKE